MEIKRLQCIIMIADSVNCENLKLTDELEGLVNAIGYREPTVRGTNVSFSYPEGFLLSRPNVTTCMGNGEWEPGYQQTEWQR